MGKRFKIIVVVSLLSFQAYSAEKIYRLTIEDAAVTKGGFTLEKALTVNGSIPAPTLEFTVGDTAVVYVTNQSKEASSVHWHGVRVPFMMDGAMFPNNLPIMPGKTMEFRFPVRDAGTYWYHSHTDLQEQRGLYGGIVVKPAGATQSPYVEDRVMVLGDWTHEDPAEILRNIKNNGHFYEFKKNSLTSWWGAFRHGAVWDYIKGQWTRMGPMDLSDIGYDAFLINGEPSSEDVRHYNPGDKIRLRFIDAGASSYFYVNIGRNRTFEVIAKDGMDVEPVRVNEILMGMGETYDIVFTVPDAGMKSYEVRATAQDITGYATYRMGHGTLESVPNKMRPNLYKMDHSGHAGHGGHDHGGHEGGGEPGGTEPGEPGEPGGDDHGGHEGHDGGHSGHENHLAPGMNSDHSAHAHVVGASDEPGGDEPGDGAGDEPGDEPGGDTPAIHRLQLDMLKARRETLFPPQIPRARVTMELTGDMDRYNWYINGKSFSEEPYIEVNEGDVVQFVMENKTMMHHPMHLHGHFFRILNGQGNRAPMAHTIDVAPMKTETIEFLANEPGIWFFHCHNLYHMKTGMTRLVKYRGFQRPPELIEHEHHMGHVESHADPRALGGKIQLFTNRAEAEVHVNQGRYEVELKMQADDYNPETFEATAVFKRYLTQYFSLVGGVEFNDEKIAGILGVQWRSPLMVDMTAYTNTRGEAVIKLSKEFPIMDRLYFTPSVKLRFVDDFRRVEPELESSLMYQITPRWQSGIFYRWNPERDNEHSVGVGLGFSF
jgi:CopA family copper-resistance protein